MELPTLKMFTNVESVGNHANEGNVSAWIDWLGEWWRRRGCESRSKAWVLVFRHEWETDYERDRTQTVMEDGDGRDDELLFARGKTYFLN